MADNWDRCAFMDYTETFGEDWEGERYGLMFEDFGDSQGYLEEQGFEGSGYTWHGIVESLMRTDYPKLAKKIEYVPESSMFVARSSDMAALKAVH